MATQQVNERLAALTAAGTSVWLDQIKRALISTGELQRLVEEDSLRGVTSNPTIFNAAILGSDDYDEQLAEARARGLDDRGIYQELAIRDIQDACDVLRVGLRRERRRRRLRLVRGRPRPRLRHRPHDGAGARVLGPRRPPQPDDQDPGHRRGHPRDRGDDLRGAQHQRHAALRRRGVRAGRRGLHPRPRAPPRGGQAARRRVGRVVLRLARGHRGRQAPGGHAATTTCSARPASPTRAPPTSATRRSSTASASPPCARPARASSARCGPRPASRTRPTPTSCTSTSSSRPNTVNTMPMATLLAAGDHAEVSGPTAEEDPTPELKALADAGIDLNDVTDQLLREGVDEVRRADGQAAGGHRRQARGDRHPAPGVDRRLAARRGRRAARGRAGQAGRTGRRRAAHLAQGRHALGPGRAGRGRQPPRLADRRRADARGSSTTCRPSPRASATRASRTSCCSGMGGSSLAPEVIRRSFGEQDGWPTPARARLDRRGRGAQRAGGDRPRPHAVPRLDEVGRDDRDAVAVQALLVAALRRRRRSSPSPTRAPASRSSRASTASGAPSSTTPTSAGATARCRTSGSCRRR